MAQMCGPDVAGGHVALRYLVRGLGLSALIPGGVGRLLAVLRRLRRYRGDGGHVASGDLGCRMLLLSSGLGSSSALARVVWPHSHDMLLSLCFEDL